MEVVFSVPDFELTPAEYRKLVGETYQLRLDDSQLSAALQKTFNVTARHNGLLVGCLRLLSDGVLFSVITDVYFSRAEQYQSHNLPVRLTEAAVNASPCSVLFASHKWDPQIMARLGWSPGFPSYVFHKSMVLAKRQNE